MGTHIASAFAAIGRSTTSGAKSENTVENTISAANLVRLLVGAFSISACRDLGGGSNGNSGQSEESGDGAELHFECCKRVELEKRETR